MVDIAIVGAGCAGLSAAIYAARAGKSVLVFEQMAYGGQIINTPEVENYPGIQKISGFDFAQSLYEQATNLGAEVSFSNVSGIEKQNGFMTLHTDAQDVEASCVILATGAKNRALGVKREAELVGRGISYCATCDGAFFKGKEIAVVGGGNTALEDALYLSTLCSKVTLIHRRDTFRGEQKTVEKLKQRDNVSFILDSQVVELIADKKLSGLWIENKKTKEISTISVSALFVAIGQEPDNQAFSNLVALDDSGYIIADESCKTNVSGIFTAGDCRTKKVRQLATAASDGAIAALAACEYLA